MKKQITKLLLSVNRSGTNELLDYMEEVGFFKSPCSSSYHLSVEGGLAVHSLNVYSTMHNFSSVVFDIDEYNNIRDSIIICSLLHDLGKCGDYGKENYVTNLIRSKTKNKTGEYDMVQSTAKPYKTNPTLKYIPHEIRSVKLAEKFIELTEDEEYAILYHNGMFVKSGYDWKPDKLSLLLHFADMWSSRVIEE